MFETSAPRIFDIPSGRPFAEDLARGVLERLDPGDPLAAAKVTIYAPTRRGARTLLDAFVALGGGGPILAPRVMTLAQLGDPMGLGVDLPDEISSTERLLTLTRLIRALASHAPHLAQEATATALARDLMGLLDQAQGERLSLDALEQAAPESHAEHWSETVRFLHILRDAWPAYLSAKGLMDPVARRAELISRQIEAWENDPPPDPVLVAGSTGSVGISADLISAIARLPQGAVILPGVDRHLDAETFRLLPGDHPDHPQAGLAALLARIGGAEGPVPREAVTPWCGEAMTGRRQEFFSLALRPAPVTDTWLSSRAHVAATAEETLAGVALIEAETSQEEAQAIAFAMREALTDPAATVALVTTDGTLGRRVSAALRRWEIVADDSAGRPLHLTPPGVFLSLLLDVALAPEGPGDPRRLLALLKHPLAALGQGRGSHLSHVRRIEITAMRKAKSGADIAAIREALLAETADRAVTSVTMTKDPKARTAATATWTTTANTDSTATPSADSEIFAWLDTLEDALAPLRALSRKPEVPLSEVMVALRVSAQDLSLNEDGEQMVWGKETGAEARSFVDDIVTHAPAFGALPPGGAPALVLGLMADRKVRAPTGQHPRVSIWGTLEARMLRADVMILGGLNEDSWPKLPTPDPWMSRAMRADFGLPPLDRRIGLSSHDFQQAFSAPRVILSRARKQDGTPTVASRWLQRITTLLGADEKKGFAPAVLSEMRERGDRYRAFAGHIARQSEGSPVDRPSPRPPIAARPDRYSVTDIEVLARDPYAIYAKRVLGLYDLDDLEPEPDMRERGNVIHKIVEGLVDKTRDAWPDPDMAEKMFDDITDDALAQYDQWPTVQAFYRARIARIRPAFLADEARRRATGQANRGVEAEGVSVLSVPGFRDVTLRGFADRIDRLPDDSYAIYDYKTGKPPTDEQVAAFAQQLPLEGAMLRDGDFLGLEAGSVSTLGHIRLKGGEDDPVTESVLEDAETLIANAFPNLRKLLADYAVEDRGYLSRARPSSILYEGSYDHLARVGEWESVDGEGGE